MLAPELSKGAGMTENKSVAFSIVIARSAATKQSSG
jgi:hypothetical protein